MKKLLFLLFLLMLLSCNISIASERILDFNSKINILDNGDILVLETIKVNVENRSIRHGIYRDSPTVYLGAFLSNQKFNVTIIDVKLDGNKVDFIKERLLNGIRIKIGSKNYYVSKGIHTYSIEYIAEQQAKSFADSEGLYWNVTGSGWIFPIERVSVDIYLPDHQQFSFLTNEAWTGKQGSTSQNFISKTNNNSIHFETTRGLSSYEGLTIQTTWNKGAITNPKNQTWQFIKNNVFWLLSIIMLLLYPLYFYNTWKKVGIDPPKDPVFPIFEPPNNISPAAMRFVREKYHDSKGFSIAIMSLAAKNHITIEQSSKKKFTLTKQHKKSESTLSKGEKAIFGYLFDKQKTVVISDKYNSRIKVAMGLLELTITNEHQEAFYKDNGKVWMIGVAISLIVLLFTWGHFFNLSSYAQSSLIMPAGAILASSFILYFAKKPYQKILAVVIPVGIIIFAMISQADKVYMAYLVIIICIIMINALFYHLIQAPTVFGQKLLSKIDGFRLYLNTAEQDRLDLMHPPEMTPKLFEKYLPYALALGVDNRWSEQFNNAMQAQGKEMGGYHPNWYIGNNYSRFNFATTASSIGAGLASSTIAAATPPAPSGGSGGFGGGGFSGGGGGGGGGGGW
ncbi:MAG: DUF2207 domain-containing protein [Proteobacteria bacterium]|nr:DUF2207 domain-containing protein [Pseudomonadota bacterium]